MTATNLPSPEHLRNLLRYDSDTGKLFWLKRPRSMFKSDSSFKRFHTRFCGVEAFTANTRGYKTGRIQDRQHFAHRVIWAMHTGQWPVDFIDHVNGDGSDNRISNLRSATHSENMQNMKQRSDSTSPYKGIYFSKKEGLWRAEIRANNVRHKLGYFKTPEAAHEAYCKAAELLHGEFARAG